MEKEAQNFEDNEPAKVGAIGEDIVKKHLQKNGWQVKKPKDVFENGASIVDFECWDKNDNHCFVEVKTYRPHKHDTGMEFYLSMELLLDYLNYEETTRTPVLIYVCDVFYHYFNGHITEPCIWKTSVKKLADYYEQHPDNYFTTKNYKLVLKFPYTDALFTPVALITNNQLDSLRKAINVMDASRKEKNQTQRSSNSKQTNDTTTPSEDDESNTHTTTSNSFETIAERLNQLPRDVCLSIIFDNKHFQHLINVIIGMTHSLAPYFTQDDPLRIITKYWEHVYGLDKEFDWIFDFVDVARETTPPHKNQAKETKNHE